MRVPKKETLKLNPRYRDFSKEGVELILLFAKKAFRSEFTIETELFGGLENIGVGIHGHFFNLLARTWSLKDFQSIRRKWKGMIYLPMFNKALLSKVCLERSSIIIRDFVTSQVKNKDDEEEEEKGQRQFDWSDSAVNRVNKVDQVCNSSRNKPGKNSVLPLSMMTLFAHKNEADGDSEVLRLLELIQGDEKSVEDSEKESIKSNKRVTKLELKERDTFLADLF